MEPPKLTDLYEKIRYPDPDYHLVIQLSRTENNFSHHHEPQLFHEDIEVKYVLSGILNVMIDDVLYTLKPGDFLVVNPFAFHANVPITGQSFAYHLIDMSPDFLKDQGIEGVDLRAEMLQKHRKFCSVIRGDAFLEELFLRIAAEEASRGPYWKKVQIHLLTAFFLHLLRFYTEEESKENRRREALRACALIEPALNAIHMDYKEPFTVETLAAYCGLSTSYFSHVFRDATGKSPITYCTEYRIRIADRILETTDVGVEEAARRCGFHDTNYFYRCYKKVFGISLSHRRAMTEKSKQEKDQ